MNIFKNSFDILTYFSQKLSPFFFNPFALRFSTKRFTVYRHDYLHSDIGSLTLAGRPQFGSVLTLTTQTWLGPHRLRDPVPQDCSYFWCLSKPTALPSAQLQIRGFLQPRQVQRLLECSQIPWTRYTWGRPSMVKNAKGQWMKSCVRASPEGLHTQERLSYIPLLCQYVHQEGQSPGLFFRAFYESFIM